MTTFEIDMAQVDTSHWRDHPNMQKSNDLWPGYHCNQDKEFWRGWGIHCSDYYELYDKQNGRCAICGRQQQRRFAIDHDHQTGTIRGLLCKTCNRNLSQQITNYILGPPGQDLKIKVNFKKVINRDKRLAEKREAMATARAKDKPPQAPLQTVKLSASVEEKMKRALESSK